MYMLLIELEHVFIIVQKKMSQEGEVPVQQVEEEQKVEEKEPAQESPENEQQQIINVQPQDEEIPQNQNNNQESEEEQMKPDIEIMNNLAGRVKTHQHPKPSPFDGIKAWYNDLTQKIGGEDQMRAHLIRTGVNTAFFITSLFLLKPITEAFAKMK